MIETREFSYDPHTGIRTWFHYDDEKDSYTLEKVQDAAPILEQNLLLRNASPENWDGDGHGVRVAQIPLHIWSELKEKGVIDDPKRLRAWLNDRDNGYYRTRGGRV